MFTVRRVATGDVDALVPLKTLVHALHVAARPDVFKVMKSEDVASWLRDRLAEEATCAWLAEDGGAPLGYILAARRTRGETSFSLPRQWFEIDEVAVEPSCRRRGIARALLGCVVAHATESGMPCVELTTWAFNEGAQSAFGNLGFERMVVRYALGANLPAGPGSTK